MSTRGFIILTDPKKNIEMAAYISSDAYPSGFGIEVLDAISNYSVHDLIKAQHERFPEDIYMVEGIQRNWYVKDKTNKDDWFNDYAYEVDGASMQLTMYHFGEKALTIPFDQSPLYRFIFEHENDLYLPLALNEKTMTLTKDYYKEMRNLIKAGAGIPEFRKIAEESRSVLYVSLGRIKDASNYNNEGFNKEVRDSDRKALTFCVSKHPWDKHFTLYIQTPFVRAPVRAGLFNSPAAAEKAIAEIVRDRPDDIRATAAIFESMSKYSRLISDVYKADDIPLEDRADQGQTIKLDMLAELKKAQKEHHLIGDIDGLFQREIEHVISNNYRWAKERLEKKDEHRPSFFDVLQDASARAGVKKNEVKEHEQTIPDR